MSVNCPPKYTEAQLAEMVPVFRKMPTYKDGPRGGCIQTTDFPDFLQKVGYQRTPEEYQVLANYFGKKNNGILTLEEQQQSAAALLDPSALLKIQAPSFDLDGDGFISSDEFKFMMQALQVNDSTLLGISFENFLVEADTNKDGKISIDECAAWIGNRIVNV